MRIAVVLILIAVILAVVIGFIRLLFSGGGTDFGVPFGAGAEGGIFVSRDGGVTFTRTHTAVGGEGGSFDFSRLDVTELTEDPELPGLWWLATEGAGMFLSRDQGVTWETMWSDENLLERATIRSFTRGPGGVLLLALDSDRRGRIWKSTDGGKTYREVYSAARDGVSINALAMPQQNAQRVLAGLTDGLLIGSTDGGETWTSVEQFDGQVNEIVFAPSSASVVYASVEGVGFMRSRDGGATWDDLARTQFFSPSPGEEGKPLSHYPKGREVLDIAVHPYDPDRILFATSSGLLLSSNGGDRFVQLPVPLRAEALPVRAATFSPRVPTTLFMTAGDGMYTSFNNGQDWRVTRFSGTTNLAHIAVSSADPNAVLIGTGAN